ncbi:MAG: ribonuclease [Sphingomonadales bacterium]|nr:ribonuclease [Sphingomonadales bacterium]MBD3772858.1 ribonuclease [Paracoccaceae bacterium]
MAEWLVEEGIGEHRAIRLDGATILAARIDWPGRLATGQVEDAVLVARNAGSARGTARFASGEEALVDRLPREASEGATIRLEVIRPAMAERGRDKLARARPSLGDPRAAPSLADSLREAGHDARIVHRFPDCDWDDLWAEAWAGRHDFAGGALDFALTPAMTLVDIDGSLPARELGLAAVAPLACALARFDLAGNIGIDFPTIEAKADRRAIDLALGTALDSWPHERTAMNGFGFVQLVARLERPSLLHRIHLHRVSACARALLRRAEAVQQPGLLLVTCHPAIEARLKPEWRAELARRTGRELRIETDPALALEGGFAQAITP